MENPQYFHGKTDFYHGNRQRYHECLRMTCVYMGEAKMAAPDNHDYRGVKAMYSIAMYGNKTLARIPRPHRRWVVGSICTSGTSSRICEKI